jgi:hypothetical protein
MLQLYVDRYTDAESGTKMAQHLGECPPCESELVVYQRIIAALQRCRPDLPADTAERLHRFCADLHHLGPGASDDTTTPA